MDDNQWLIDYFQRYQRTLFGVEVRPQLIALRDLIRATTARKGKLVIGGNGGSAAIAGHCVVDFTKNAGVRCLAFNQAELVTCLANDYGYERWLERALDLYADDGDLVVLISSSGKSPNIVRAAEAARARGLTVVTFTGFSADNPLRARGHLNFWVDSHAYNIVEMTHQIWLLAVCDLLIGAAEYPAS